MDTPTIVPLPPFIPRKPNRYKPRLPVAPIAAPPVGPVSILSAIAAEDGQSLVLTFSAGAGPVSVDGGVTPDFNFAVGEQQPDHVISASGATVTLAFPGGIGPGDSWSMSAQPNWLITGAVVPEAGSVG